MALGNPIEVCVYKGIKLRQLLEPLRQLDQIVKARREFLRKKKIESSAQKIESADFFCRTGISMTRGFTSSLQISLIHITTTVVECYF